MIEQYTPSREEVFKEIHEHYFGLKKNKQRLNRIAKAIKNAAITAKDYVSRNFVKPLGKMLVAPYVMPTMARKGYEKTKSEEKENFDGLISRGIMKSAILVGGAVHLKAVYNAVQNEQGKQALALVATTNALSGLYEIGRRIYNKKRDEIIQRKTLENLA